jgi:ribonuclease-3
VKTDQITRLETCLDYHFNNKSFLEEALTHRSIGQVNNERLEYLGDALLGFIIAEALYKLYPDTSEGELTRLRSVLVKGDTLAELARQLDLGNYIKLGTSELKSGGWRRKSILANALEALIGAIYLDSSLESCRKTVLTLYQDLLRLHTPDNLIKDPKTRLQELLQSRQLPLPEYTIIKEKGEAHQKIFTVRCNIPEVDISVQSDGRSKRNAEQSAAQVALEQLDFS